MTRKVEFIDNPIILVDDGILPWVGDGPSMWERDESMEV